MVSRLTLVNRRIEASEQVRHGDLQRRCSGFQYWCALPFAPIFVYYMLIWSLVMALSSTPGIRRLVERI